jgi:hypothetical protein
MNDQQRPEKPRTPIRSFFEVEGQDASYEEMERDFKRTRPERRAFFRKLNRQRKGR